LAKVKTEDRRVAKLGEVELLLETATTALAHRTSQAEELKSRLAISEEERDTNGSELITHRQQAELLRMDKEHLVGAQRDAVGTISHLKDQITSQQDTIKELSKSREESYERLLKSKEENAAEFEHRLHDQVQSIRERNREELEELQRNTRVMLEAENRSCRFGRDSAVGAQQQLERELKSKSAQLEELQQTFNTYRQTYSARFPTEIYSRACHWFPRLLASTPARLKRAGV
jgi:chromosome segregation ATPase